MDNKKKFDDVTHYRAKTTKSLQSDLKFFEEFNIRHPQHAGSSANAIAIIKMVIAERIGVRK